MGEEREVLGRKQDCSRDGRHRSRCSHRRSVGTMRGKEEYHSFPTDQMTLKVQRRGPRARRQKKL